MTVVLANLILDKNRGCSPRSARAETMVWVGSNSSHLVCAVNIRRVAANSARTSDGRDILQDLAAADERYYPMPEMTDQAELTFPAPARKAGQDRTVFLHSRGWYQLHLHENDAPDLATFSKLLTVPDAAVQFAADRFAEWRHGLVR